MTSLPSASAALAAFFPNTFTSRRAQTMTGGILLFTDYVPGQPFFALGGDQNTMRLSYSRATPEQITLGMRALGETFREALA